MLGYINVNFVGEKPKLLFTQDDVNIYGVKCIYSMLSLSQ